MATTTVTASAALTGPALIHAGVNVARVTYLASSRTLGDTILALRIPTNVDVVGVYGRIGTAETAAGATVGISGANTVFGSLNSGATPVFATNGAQGYRVSLSDDANPRYTFITVAPSGGSWTTTATVDLVVMYVHA